MTSSLKIVILLLTFYILPSLSEETKKASTDNHVSQPKSTAVIASKTDLATSSPNDILKTSSSPIPCTCGVFMSGQFTRGSHSQPKGNPVLMHEYEDVFPCTAVGNKQCINKCLDVLAKHLHNSPAIICGAMDRDCYKERAYLWIQNCNKNWINSNLSAGREYCCKNGSPYKCPLA
ncbi:follicle cell protein 3C-1 [Nilaparvata lugens]|uniref:follicle cell protein 3C-1 n=1 Tax=Nilaparvata lugens TaxID=108931 RepID=UPI00193E71C0|nr:follicle cell protein 3C-1 [Nilaparvata lugens]